MTHFASAAANSNGLAANAARGIAERNLYLLRAIDTTLDTLKNYVTLLGMAQRAYADVRRQLEPVQTPIDADGRINTLLERATTLCQSLYTAALGKRASAQADPALHDEDCMVDAYDDYLQALEATFDAAEDLRNWIGDHDSCFSAPLGKATSSVDDLFKSLLT